MKTLSNADGDTLFAYLQDQIGDSAQFDMAVSQLSVFAVEVLGLSSKGVKTRLMLSASEDLALLGDDKDRLNRGKLNHRHLSQNTSGWLRERTEVRRTDKGVPQGIIVVREGDKPRRAIVGSFALSTEGIGLAPGNPLSFIQVFEGDEAAAPAKWFDQQWNALPANPGLASALADQTEAIVEARAPRELYSLMLYHLLGAEDGGIRCVLVVNGEVALGVDLEKARIEDIDPDARTVTLILLLPKVHYARLDHERTKIYSINRQGL